MGTRGFRPPYIIANGLMYDAFAQIAAAVPDARMMTNSVANNGNPFGAGDYRANFDKIRRKIRSVPWRKP